MNTLADFTPATRKVALSEGRELTVRGLTLPDVTLLVTVYKDSVQAAADDFFAHSAGENDYMALALHMLQVYPIMMAQVIACGCGDSSLMDRAMNLPFPLQVELLTATVQMTFEDTGGPKAFAASLLRIAKLAGVTTAPAGLVRLAAVLQSGSSSPTTSA